MPILWTGPGQCRQSQKLQFYTQKDYPFNKGAMIFLNISLIHFHIVFSLFDFLSDLYALISSWYAHMQEAGRLCESFSFFTASISIVFIVSRCARTCFAVITQSNLPFFCSIIIVIISQLAHSTALKITNQLCYFTIN